MGSARSKVLERVYGFAFPDDLYAFHDFWTEHGALWERPYGGLALVGPFELLEKPTAKVDPGGDWPRFYNDPPELFTVIVGDIDGEHGGYWFDDPNDTELTPVIASYHANDAFEMAEHGTLFEILRENVELVARDAEEYRESDPENAAEYDERLEVAARQRDALSGYALGERKETGGKYADKYMAHKTARRVVAKTRHRMGVVVPKAKYAPLAPKDPFEVWDYVPKARDVKALVDKARALAAGGKPGAALKLGHDLWGYQDFHAESGAMLDLAYEALGRDILRRFLARASEFRRACDARRQ